MINPIPRRPLAALKKACKYGGFGRTKCYRLIEQGRIKAYKFDRTTLIDLDSIDELLATLPRIKSNTHSFECKKPKA